MVYLLIWINIERFEVIRIIIIIIGWFECQIKKKRNSKNKFFKYTFIAIFISASGLIITCISFQLNYEFNYDSTKHRPPFHSIPFIHQIKSLIQLLFVISILNTTNPNLHY